MAVRRTAMGSYEYALRFRTTLRGIVESEIERLRPRSQMATVVSIDRHNSKCIVTFPGDPAQVPVNMGAIQPTASGQIVRIEGLQGDRYVADIVSGTAFDLGAPLDLGVMQPLHAAFARRAFEPVRILVMGDSISEGSLAGWGDPSAPPIRLARWQGKLESRLRAKYGITSGSVYIPAMYVDPLTADDTVRTGTVTEYPNVGIGLGIKSLGMNAGATVTWPAITCDRMRLWYTKTDFFAGVVNVKIDGATITSINNQQASPLGLDSGYYLDYAVTSGSHTFQLEATQNGFLVDAVQFFNGEGGSTPLVGKGIHLFDGAHSGAMASLYLPAVHPSIDDGHWKTAAVIKPHCTIIALGTNDVNAYLTPAQFAGDMEDVVERAIAAAGGEPTSVILVKPSRPGTTALNKLMWAALMGELDKIASANPQVTTFDMQRHWPQLVPSGVTNLGLMIETEGVHPTASGHTKWADILSWALTYGA